MKLARKYSSILSFRIERLAFALFALLWTTNLGGCQNTADEPVAVKYGSPSPTDSLVAKYGVPTEDSLQDSIALKYGVFQKDSTRDTVVVPIVPDDPIMMRYGCPPSVCGQDTTSLLMERPADVEEIAERWSTTSREGSST